MKASCLLTSQWPAFCVPIGIPQVAVPGNVGNMPMKASSPTHCRGKPQSMFVPIFYAYVVCPVMGIGKVGGQQTSCFVHTKHTGPLDRTRVNQSALPVGSFALCSVVTTFPGNCLLASKLPRILSSAGLCNGTASLRLQSAKSCCMR